MIRSFRHDGLKRFFETGSKVGIQPVHALRLRKQLSVLNNASVPRDMDTPGWGLHELKGDLKDHWSVRVSGNWRMTFRFENGDAILLDYQDYH